MTYFKPSAKTTTDGKPLIEGPCEVIRPLRVPDEADADVGPMYLIRMSNGVETGAFDDELTEKP
jgi:hypothetical protein